LDLLRSQPTVAGSLTRESSQQVRNTWEIDQKTLRKSC